MWESNPPRTLQTPNTGFEDQEAHQLPFYPHIQFSQALQAFFYINAVNGQNEFLELHMQFVILFSLTCFLYYQIIVDFSRVFVHNIKYKLNFILERGLFVDFLSILPGALS